MRQIAIVLVSLTILCAGQSARSSFSAAAAPPQTWTPLNNQPGFSAGNALLLTDGTVMVQQVNSGQWWRLSPDNSGSYVNGTWSQLASMPAGYGPLYYASAVLADGRVVVEGGEYNFGGAPVWSTLGAIYEPRTNSWTPISPPAGWSTIGDAQSAVLANGTFMLANCCSTEAALLNSTTLTWTATGTNKADSNNEEGWTLLPNGRVLTVDVRNGTNSEVYNPSNGKWTSAGSTIAALSSGSPSYEIGPAVLRPDGTVFATGGTSNTAIYNTVSGTWSAGPTFPGGLDIADGPAALLPNGNVLADTSPGIFNPPSVFFEFDGTNLISTASPPRASFEASYVGSMLVLPTGQILFTDQSSDVEIYTPGGTYQSAWKPTITSVASVLNPGSANNAIAGTQFNGLSQGAMYGDDSQTATNYPLVRITNNATGHVFYARTHNHSTMGVATGATPVSTQFDVLSNVEAGASTLQVVANGIPSNAVGIVISGTPVINLALNKPATQSSTAYGGVAGRAVDGNTSGVFTDLSITATNGDPHDWWQVDLGAISPIHTVNLYNRTECCGNRLSNFYVFVSDAPFTSNDPEVLATTPGVTNQLIPGQAGPITSLTFSRTGRYVRVHLRGANILSLAEVEVLGTSSQQPLTNLALNKPAAQSTTAYGGVASRAVDGNTSGVFTDLSITATNGDPHDWWQVDLGAISTIQTVKLYNRTECCGDRLSNFYVFVSDSPFTSNDPEVLAAMPGVTNQWIPGQAGPITTLAFNRTGRYVRVHLRGTNILSLAEVEVLGTSAPQPTNLALNKPATQSTTGYGGVASRAVDGNTSGVFTDLSITATNGDSQGWWHVDLGAGSTIQSVTVYNRTECCGDRLNNSYVFVSDTPFGARTLNDLLTDPSITNFPIDQAPAQLTLSVNRSGRYVRVQLSGTNILSLAEVQVLGTFN